MDTFLFLQHGSTQAHPILTISPVGSPPSGPDPAVLLQALGILSYIAFKPWAHFIFFNFPSQEGFGSGDLLDPTCRLAKSSPLLWIPAFMERQLQSLAYLQTQDHEHLPHRELFLSR